MARFWNRQYLIDIGNGAKVFDSRQERYPLQIDFSVETSFGGAESLMELSIFNLSKDSIGQILEHREISLQAGYPELFGPIFQGKISNIETPRDDTERRTTLYCWSGLAELQSKLCEVSFAPGTLYADIVDFVATDIFSKPPVYIGFDAVFRQSMGVATDGYNTVAPHKTILRDLGKAHGFDWLIENERCVLFQRGAYRPGERFEVSPRTGLVGGVSLTWLGADFQMKLNPRIQIGDRVKIDAETSTINFSQIYRVGLPKSKTVIGDGYYVVKQMRRVGAYYGESSPWHSELVCWREGEDGTGLQEAAA